MQSIRAAQLANSVRESSLSITASDGYVLGGTRFEPSTKHTKLVIINGAIGVRHHFYGAFARYLADAGLDVIAYDYRGIGSSRSEPLRTMTATMADWGIRDFEAVLRYAVDVLGYRKLRLVGHSVGGQLFGFAQSSNVIDRVVGVAAQLADYRLWPAPSRWRVAAMMRYIVPSIVRALGYLPRGLAGEPLPRGVALEWARWCTTAGYFTSALSKAERHRFERYGGRILAYSVNSDPFAPRPTVDAWLALFAKAARDRQHLRDPALGHFGFFKPGRGMRYWPEVRAFLNEP